MRLVPAGIANDINQGIWMAAPIASSVFERVFSLLGVDLWPGAADDPFPFGWERL